MGFAPAKTFGLVDIQGKEKGWRLETFFFRIFAIGMLVPGVLSLSAGNMKKTVEFFYSSNVMLNVQFLPDSFAGGSQES